MCGHKLKTPQQSRTRGKLGLRIVSLMIYFNSLSTAGKISKSVLDQRHKVDTEFNLSRVLMSVVVTQALPIWIRDSAGRKKTEWIRISLFVHLISSCNNLSSCMRF